MTSDLGAAMRLLRTTANNATTIDALRRQLQTNLGVAPFVGAGFSVPCGLPHWSGLLLSLAGEVGAAESVEEHLAAGRFEEAAGEVQQRLGRDSFSTRLNDILGESAIKNLCGPVLQVPALTRGPVLTTNLDYVLEKVFDNAGLPFTHIGQGPDVETVYRALHQDQPFLLKLHGGLIDSDTRVLTLGDYVRAYGSREAVYTSRELPLPHLLEQIFTTRTLLFLGCSLFLDRTLTYMRRVKDLHAAPARHFAILEDPGTTESRFDRETFLKGLNISPIWFPLGRYELIGDLLDEVLEPQLRMTLDVSSVDAPRPPFAGYLGVDLGTSYSSVAYSGDGKNVEFLRFPQAGGRALIPSVVRFLTSLEYEIGEQAPASRLSIVAEIRHFKRDLGTDKRYRVGRRHYTPAQVATLFLKGVRHAFAQQFGSPLPPTIVSAPANFGMRQVNDLIGAYHNAGFDVKRVVGEPCAAALNARELDLGDPFAVLVVDIGGGTTDISVVEVAIVDNEFMLDICSVAGDNALGGLDFDHVIAHVRDRLAEEYGGQGDVLYEQRCHDIRIQACAVKVALNSQMHAHVVLRDLELSPGELEDRVVEITRDDFRESSSDLLERIGNLVDKALAEALSSNRVSTVMLAGQASKIAPVAECIGGRVALPIIQRFQDIAVARGLALQASVLDGKLRDLLLLDCIYRELCLALEEDTLATDYKGKPLDESEITYAHGRHFLRGLYKNVNIPTRAAFSIAFKSECNETVLELFEYGDQVDDPLSPVGRIFVQFIEPASWVWIAFDVDANHTICLEVGTGKLISKRASKNEVLNFLWRKHDRQIVVQVNNLHLSEKGRFDIGSVVRL